MSRESGEHAQDSVSRHPGREAIRDPEKSLTNLEQLGPGSTPPDHLWGLGRDDEVESSLGRSPELQRGLAPSTYDKRLLALQDVLAHPGKHAARMARALYRAAYEPGGRLLARSPDEILLDRMNAALDAHQRADGDEVARFHALVLEPG